MPSKMKTCEDYREALMEAAAANAEPSHELRAHLDACLSCRAAFAEELQLFSAIDVNVRSIANAEVPSSFLPRVRAELNERSVPHRLWLPAGAAIAVAAALLVAIIIVRERKRDVAEPNSPVSSVAHNVLPAETKLASAAADRFKTGAAPVKNRQGRPINPASAASVEQVAVLIPVGQKLALDALLTNVRHGKVEAGVVLDETPEKSLEEIQVLPLGIQPIEVKPLPDVGTDSPSTEQKATK